MEKVIRDDDTNNDKECNLMSPRLYKHIISILFMHSVRNMQINRK